MNRVLALMIHIWRKYGECGLNHSGVIALRRCYDLEGQGMTLKMKIKVTHNKRASCPTVTCGQSLWSYHASKVMETDR